MENLNETNVSFSNDTPKKNKKKLIIAAIIAAVVILLGGVGSGVYAFMNSPQVKFMNANEKIQHAKKADGTLKLTGKISVPTILTSENVDLDVDGTYTMSKQAENDTHFQLKAKTDVKGTEHFQRVLDTMKLSGDYSVKLTKAMIVEWTTVTQQGTHELSESQAREVKKFLESDGNGQSEEQKDTQALYRFLFKGQSIPMSVDGNKATITLNKSDVEKLITGCEKNIATDTTQFEQLYKKAFKDATTSDIQLLIEKAQAGAFTKQAKVFLDAIEKLQILIVSEDLGNQVKQTSDIDVKFKQEQSGITINGKVNMKLDTTYYM